MTSLILLFRLKSAGAFRQLWRSLKTPEGAIRGVFTILFCLLLCAPLLATLLTAKGEIPAEFVAEARNGIARALPFFLAFMCLACSQTQNNTLDFSQTEIDLLFGGPFSRRDLLLYKLLGIVSSTAVIAAAFAMLLGSGLLFLGGNPIANIFRGYIVLFFSLLFLRLIFTLSGLVRRSVLLRFYSPLRKVFGIAFLILLFFGFVAIRRHFKWDTITDPQEIFALANRFFDSRASQVISYPFKIFSNLLLAQTIAATGIWASACMLANGLILFLIVKADANFLESSVHFSQLKAENLKRQQSVEGSFVPSGIMGTIPMLPFLRGAGPIAWRQLQTFYRSRVYLIVGMLLYYAFTIFLMSSTPNNSEQSDVRFSLVAVMIISMSGILPIIVPMGFHNDTNKMEIFKGLPFEKWEIAAGQLLGPVIAITLMQWITICLFMFSAFNHIGYWFALALFAPLTTTVVLCVVNSLALLYPSKRDSGVAREFENVGHILVFVFLMFVVAMSLIAILSGVGVAAYFLTSSIVVTLVTCWLTLLAASAGGVWTTGWAFQRYDVSKHR